MLTFMLFAMLASSCIKIVNQSPVETTQPPQRNISESKVSIRYPTQDERFIQGESVILSARAGGNQDQLQWTSNRDGTITYGAESSINSLSEGTHLITVSAGNAKDTVQIRVFRDLGQLYKQVISEIEIERIKSDFNINWLEGSSSDEKWGNPDTYPFNQQSGSPSRIVALSKLDVLRHQQFSQPLPFTTGKSAYNHLKQYLKQINLRLDCGISTAGDSTVNLNRNFSVWDLRQSGSSQNPDACKVPLNNPPELSDYISSLYLILHEGRHCEPSDPGHVTCAGKGNMDKNLENGSGHATAALYLLWIYKYSLYDSPQTREQAKLAAVSILQNRFCNTPQHSDPAVQSLLNELGIK